MRFSIVERRDIVVIGASTGGIEALREVVQTLPPDFPGSIFVAMHIGPVSLLPEILARSTKIKTVAARHGDQIQPGRIYVAPPNRHLLLEDGHITLSAGPRENGHRPAIDPLFRSAAKNFRARVTGVILSGGLDDGSAGLFAVKARGGAAVVQNPDEAIAPDMPRNAMKNVAIDYCVPAAEVAAVLTSLARGEADATIEKNGNMKTDPGTEPISADPPPAEQHIALACPECSGPLYEERAGDSATFRCNVQHKYSPLSLTAAHDEALERALWVAIRTLNERITLYHQMLRRERNEGEDLLFKRMEQSLQIVEQDVVLLRQIIERI